VRDAWTQAARDEREMRVRVARLHGALRGVEVSAALEAIVLVPRAFRKHRAERIHVRRYPRGAQPCAQAAIEKTGSGVGRPVEAVRKRREGVAVFGREPGSQINNFETGVWSKLERQIERICSH